MAQSRTYAQMILATPGLIGYWRLDQSTGVARDASGHLGFYTPTIAGAPKPAPGALPNDSNAGISCDGTNDYIDLGNGANVQLTTLSLEVWAKTTYSATSPAKAMFVKQNAFSLFVGTGGTNTVNAYDWTNSHYLDTGVFIGDGFWHHVVLTMTSGVAGGSVVYVDAKAKVTDIITVSNQTHPLQIGYGNFSNQEWPGSLDEAALYNRVLTPAEVWDHYNARTLGPTRRQYSPNLPSGAVPQRSLLGVGA
jgi:hypothetical protein